VIDGVANCTAMVHLPGKHALSCAMKKCAAIRGEGSGAAARQEHKLQGFAIDGRARRRRDAAARCRAGYRSSNFLRSHLVRRARMRCDNAQADWIKRPSLARARAHDPMLTCCAAKFLSDGVIAGVQPLMIHPRHERQGMEGRSDPNAEECSIAAAERGRPLATD
jgi:hypothetical protein